MSKPMVVYTCKNCGYDNPQASHKCNNCFITFYNDSFFGKWETERFIIRWVCKNCGRLNVEGNNTCSACFQKK